MPMPPYQILCTTKGCKHPAEYKIAARWSDGVVSELKTYGLCCNACLKACLLRGRESYQRCRLIPGETLETAGIYQLQHGKRDQVLDRLLDLERSIIHEGHEEHEGGEKKP